MIKFIKRDEASEVKHVIHEDYVTWRELLEEFYIFLLGCGYLIEREEFVLDECCLSSKCTDCGHTECSCDGDTEEEDAFINEFGQCD